MKKFLLSLCACLVAVTSVAQSYTEDITVTIDGESSDPVEAAITVTRNDNGTCDFVLRNFRLVSDEADIPVGNIVLNGVTMEDNGTYQAISTDQVIAVAAGDDPNEPWIGPELLTEVPIVLTGKITKDHLYATIDIDMSALLGQKIFVVIGNESTGIAQVLTPASEQAVYSLSGVRVAEKMNQSLSKGLYIVGGKKIIKK